MTSPMIPEMKFVASLQVDEQIPGSQNEWVADTGRSSPDGERCPCITTCNQPLGSWTARRGIPSPVPVTCLFEGEKEPLENVQLRNGVYRH